MDWLKENLVAFVKAYGPWTAVGVLASLVALAAVLAMIGVDVTEFLP